MLASPLAGSCASHANANSKPVPFFPLYSSKTEFLSYVLLYLVKMPFPPVTKAQTHPCPANQRLAGPSPIFPDKTTEEKNLVKERLKKLTKKATPHKSKLPTSLATAGMKLEGKSAWMTTTKPTQQSNLLASASSKRSFRNSTSGSTSATNSPAPLSTKKILPNSISTTSMASNIITDSSSPQAYSGCLEASSLENGEARNFTLNLTPEATLLLQKRCGKQHHGNVTVTRQSHLSTKLASRSNIPVLKISLLNDRHKYDDVEYEEDTDLGVDQSVLLKCSEWLRGVENAAGATVQTRMGSQKSF